MGKNQHFKSMKLKYGEERLITNLYNKYDPRKEERNQTNIQEMTKKLK